MPADRCRVLFVAEGATLAHVARPLVLAKELNSGGFEILFARPPGFRWLTGDSGLVELDLDCQDTATFVRRLDRGLPLYDFATLDRYVQADLALIDQVKPDVVVGDFRLSLSVSSRLRKVPYVTICDAYWSPECPLTSELPVMALTPYVPISMASAVFRAVAPLAFRAHAVPMERLRKRYGLPGFGHDLRCCYTDADWRLFANFPELFPEVRRSATADFIGPVAWSPPDRQDLEFPEGDGPLIYVTMGSSGDPTVLATLIPALEAMGAGPWWPAPASLYHLRLFRNGHASTISCPATRCAGKQLVICNGGSPTTNQALRHGVPVLGIARNMDQFLNMGAITRFGAGLTMRSDRLDSQRLKENIIALRDDVSFMRRANQLGRSAWSGDILSSVIKMLC